MTLKQKKAIEFINKYLDTNYEPKSISEASLIIGKNLNKAKKVREDLFNMIYNEQP